MVKMKLLPPLIALAALMLVVSGTLAAVLLSDGGGDDDSSNASALTSGATEAPSATTAPQAAAEPTPDIPETLRARFDALPDKLRNEALKAYQSGSIDDAMLQQIIEDYENRNPSVRVGSVVSTAADSVSIEVYTTGERAAVDITDETVIRRAQRDIAPTDLQVNELVMVVSMDEGKTAFSIDAFGVAAP